MSTRRRIARLLVVYLGIAIFSFTVVAAVAIALALVM